MQSFGGGEGEDDGGGMRESAKINRDVVDV